MSNFLGELRKIVADVEKRDNRWIVGHIATFEHELEDGEHPFSKIGLKNGMKVRIDGIHRVQDWDGVPLSYRISFRLAITSPCGPEGTVEPVKEKDLHEFNLSYDWSRLSYQRVTLIMDQKYLKSWTEYAGDNERRVDWNVIEWPGSDVIPNPPHQREDFIFQNSGNISHKTINPGEKAVILFQNGVRHADTDPRVIEGLMVKMHDAKVIGSLRSGLSSIESYEVYFDQRYHGEQAGPSLLAKISPCDIISYSDYKKNPKNGVYLMDAMIFAKSNWS